MEDIDECEKEVIICCLLGTAMLVVTPYVFTHISPLCIESKIKKHNPEPGKVGKDQRIEWQILNLQNIETKLEEEIEEINIDRKCYKNISHISNKKRNMIKP